VSQNKTSDKLVKAIQKAVKMNLKVPDVQVSRKSTQYKFISPYKWVIAFVGPEKYDCDIQLEDMFNQDVTNLNLVIVGINIFEESEQAQKYSNLCKQTREGFYVNIDISHIEENNEEVQEMLDKVTAFTELYSSKGLSMIAELFDYQ